MNKQLGFSLLELVVTLIVLAIIAVTVMVRMPSTDPFSSQGYADSFIQDLRLTQVLAMSKNQRYCIEIGATSYQIKDNTLGTAIVNPATGTTSVTYPAGTITPNPRVVIFDSLGTPYTRAVNTCGTSSVTALSSASSYTVTSGTATNTVVVTPLTGFIQ